MTPEVAVQRIQSFKNQFGQPHLYLSYHAAFPLTLTPDLLYSLWGNFQCDVNNQHLNIPWIAVADLLLSHLCDEVGHELYEMDRTVRNQLLKELKSEENLGETRLNQLSNFLIGYAQQQLQSSDPDIRELAQSQYWTALFYTQPSEAIRQLALALRELGLDVLDPEKLNAKAEIIRMTSLLETLAESLTDENFRPLLIYARAMASFVRGDEQTAATELSTITTLGKIQVAGIDLPIPESLKGKSLELNPTKGPNYSGQNLRGRSFKGKDLTGANFSSTDLRGTNFTNAKLTGVDFSNAKMGLQRRWATGLILISFLLLVLIAISTTLIGGLAGLGVFATMENSSSFERNLWFASGLAGPIMLAVAYLITLLQGLQTNLLGAGSLALIGTVYVAAGVTFALAVADQQLRVAPASVAIILSGIAVISVLPLVWSLTRRRRLIRGIGFILNAALAIALVAVTFSSSGAYPTLIISLCALIFVAAIVFVWISARAKTLARILLLALLWSVLLSSLLLAPLWVTAATSNLGAAMLLSIPIVPVGLFITASLVLAGVWSLAGAITGIISLTIAVGSFFLWAWLSSQLFVEDVWGPAGGILIISIAAAALAWSLTIAIAVSTVLAWTESESIVLSLIWSVAVAGTPIITFVYFLSTFAYWLRVLVPSSQIENGIVSGLIGTGLSVTIISLGIYIGWRVCSQDQKFASIRQFAITLASGSGTNFRGADLTNASFINATLKSTDFRKANLTHTDWTQAQKLNLACLEGSYLLHPQVQKLLVTRTGTEQNFDRMDLQGINLRKANLANASLIGTNLKEASLRGADLSGAKLFQTQLDQADLTGACLTGAYIQDLQLTPNIKLRGIECDYIYTRIPTKDNPDPVRVPTNNRRVFRPDELASFLKHHYYR